MKIKKEIVFNVGIICILTTASSLLSVIYGNNQVKEYSSEKEVSYIIMDASVEYIEEDVIIFTVALPNGNKETFTSDIEDVPLNTSEVVIETSNIDDVSTYKIVGLR